MCFSVPSDFKRHIYRVFVIMRCFCTLLAKSQSFLNVRIIHGCTSIPRISYTWCFILSVSHSNINPPHHPPHPPVLPLSLSLLFSIFFQRETDLECFHGSWDRVVSCQPVDCGLPDQSHVYHAIFSCPWGTTFGKQCSFTCGSPAILQGKLWICLFYSSLLVL